MRKQLASLRWHVASVGQITKRKLLKRQMFGRASFELLRRHALLAA
jgi:transposase